MAAMAAESVLASCALHKLSVEPKVLLAVLRQLHDTPTCRQHLTDPAFREMFTLPPLRQRRRLSAPHPEIPCAAEH